MNMTTDARAHSLASELVGLASQINKKTVPDNSI